jgi:hypothetical protein
VFIRRSSSRFYIISVFVDDFNIIDHTKNIDEAKMEFEMKDFGRTKICLGLELEKL